MAQLQRAESLGPLETARAAVRALYGADPSAQAQANAWLLSFAGTAAAWRRASSVVLGSTASLMRPECPARVVGLIGTWYACGDGTWSWSPRAALTREADVFCG